LLVGLVGALAGSYVFIYAKDAMVMVASALNGAMIVAWDFVHGFIPVRGSWILLQSLHSSSWQLQVLRCNSNFSVSNGNIPKDINEPAKDNK